MFIINNKKIKSFSKNINSDNNVIIRNAVSNNKLKDITKNTSKLQKINRVFSKEIDIKVKNTNQKNSGRCWIFAFLNLIRLSMIKKYNLEEDFELSQNYLFFWDKLEKSNFFFIGEEYPTRCRLLSSKFIIFFPFSSLIQAS